MEDFSVICFADYTGQVFKFSSKSNLFVRNNMQPSANLEALFEHPVSSPRLFSSFCLQVYQSGFIEDALIYKFSSNFISYFSLIQSSDSFRKLIRESLLAFELSKIFQKENSSLIFCVSLSLNLGDLLIMNYHPNSYKQIEQIVSRGFDKSVANLAVLGYDPQKKSLELLGSNPLLEKMKPQMFGNSLTSAILLLAKTIIEKPINSPILLKRLKEVYEGLGLELSQEAGLKQVEEIHSKVLGLEQEMF